MLELYECFLAIIVCTLQSKSELVDSATDPAV